MRLPSPADESASLATTTLVTFLWSRAAIWIGALLAALTVPWSDEPAQLDPARLTHDLGLLVNVWARWDSVWFLRIAEGGYAMDGSPAFYPLYPFVVGLFGRVLFGHYVLAGVLVSLAAATGSALLLATLAQRHLGAAGARRAVLYFAIFPMSLFLQAVYSESLFLLLALAAFVCAERRAWWAAGAITGLAMLTRPTGFSLLAAVAVLAFCSEERLRALGRLAVAPLLFLAYPLLLWAQRGDPFAFAGAEATWHRELSVAGPFGGMWHALRASWAGVLQLTVGSDEHWYWVAENPARVAAMNLQNTAFLALYLVLAVVAWRRFGAAYGLFALLCVLVPASAPTTTYPLLSMPRFGLVAFPIFLALAALGRSAKIHTVVVALSAGLLGVYVTQWATWQWVS